MKRLNEVYKKYSSSKGSSQWGEGFSAYLYKDIESNKKIATQYLHSKVAYFGGGDECKYTKSEKPSFNFVVFNIVSDVEIQFNESAAKWKKETGAYSTVARIAGNDNYLDIIGMGKPVVPFILKDLKKEVDFWFIALQHITKENPVPKEHIGDMEKMRLDWLVWGKKNNLI